MIASVLPAVTSPACTFVIVRFNEDDPTDTVFARSATELEPSATLPDPDAVACFPNAVPSAPAFVYVPIATPRSPAAVAYDPIATPSKLALVASPYAAPLWPDVALYPLATAPGLALALVPHDMPGTAGPRLCANPERRPCTSVSSHSTLVSERFCSVF
ncbi:hypothetical protein C6V04_07145 [Burkholderia multivorans]|nr:hypothetical protein C6V04_07145 [Burkholderia multivorans]